jgi:glycosyltransferase involved in cell wall biosynthesis
MSTPQFSIATPTRNAFDKLRRCVGSVRGQTGVVAEHLVQDACSSDGTPPWLAAQTARADGVFGVSEKDSGMYDAINRAWDRGRGEFFSWLNADEQYLPGTLQRVAAYFAAHPQVDVLFANYIVADPAGRPVALRREIPLRRIYVTNSFLNTQSCTLFYRRKLWDQGLLRLDSRFRYAADQDLVLRLMAAGAVVAHLPEYLSIFGVDGTNLSTHPQMEIEAEQVRLAFGGFKWKAMRQLPLMGRRVERLLLGAYKRETLRYQFATDETPQYVAMQAQDLGGRYTLADVQGQGSDAQPGTPT